MMLSSSLCALMVCIVSLCLTMQYLDAMSSPIKARVIVRPNLSDVGAALCADFIECAREDIASKGSFYCAVPGGSVLKLLGALKGNPDANMGIDWAAVHLFYVNHKCVSNEDPSSTHLKAKKLFLDHFTKINAHAITCFSQTESMGHDTTAHLYSQDIARTVPKEVFDYMLLGVGKDGHIGSLYPNRKELAETGTKVLSCDKKVPPSVTLSLSMMNNARRIRIALMGEDKADAAVVAVMKTRTKEEFPVCGIVDSDKAAFFLDEPAASALKAILKIQ